MVKNCIHTINKNSLSTTMYHKKCEHVASNILRCRSSPAIKSIFNSLKIKL